MSSDLNPRLCRRCFVLAAGAVFFALTACAAATPPAPSGSEPGECAWNYENPADWWKICPQYAACGNGSRQSPINVVGALARTLPALEYSYDTRSVTVVDTGHDIQVNLPAGGSTSLTVGGRTYQLAQFHFHEPSEHKINGVGAEMEIHFVHVDQGGELAVVGVLVRKDPADRPNPTIGLILEALAQGRPATLNPRALLPSTSYYGYAGSLTTPPCTEGVRWHLLDSWITVSQGQIDKFKEYHAGNARLPQNANGRVILKKE